MKRTKRAPVASQRVADLIAERILSGRLEPGERLKQDELAAELGLSRIPVRDAFRILETRGLVTMRANAGARVATLTVRDMELSYRIREHLEPMLLAESMPNLSEADFAEMRAVKAGLDAVREVEEYLILLKQFHWMSFRGHGAPLLAQMVEWLWDTTHSYRRAHAELALADPKRRSGLRAERDRLFGAITGRDTDLAAGILGAQIRRTYLGLIENGELLGEAAE